MRLKSEEKERVRKEAKRLRKEARRLKSEEKERVRKEAERLKEKEDIMINRIDNKRIERDVGDGIVPHMTFPQFLHVHP